MPPLREMRSDIPGIARHLWAQLLAESVSGRDWRTLAQQLIGRVDLEVGRVLMGFDWPGNARQLYEYLRRVYVLAGQDPTRCDADLFRRALGAEPVTYQDRESDR